MMSFVAALDIECRVDSATATTERPAMGGIRC